MKWQRNDKLVEIYLQIPSSCHLGGAGDLYHLLIDFRWFFTINNIISIDAPGILLMDAGNSRDHRFTF